MTSQVQRHPFWLKHHDIETLAWIRGMNIVALSPASIFGPVYNGEPLMATYDEQRRFNTAIQAFVECMTRYQSEIQTDHAEFAIAVRRFGTEFGYRLIFIDDALGTLMMQLPGRLLYLIVSFTEIFGTLIADWPQIPRIEPAQEPSAYLGLDEPVDFGSDLDEGAAFGIDVNLELFERSDAARGELTLKPSVSVLIPAHLLSLVIEPPEDAECSICTEDAGADGLVKPVCCTHLFHLSCLEKWTNGPAEISNKYPCCRRVVSPRRRTVRVVRTTPVDAEFEVEPPSWL
ncbi:hypothetical protein EK21DRAFT_110592 [Setomelanomma holmii]|uniref:RING-type domain-containing protein n=1 Tax=Setomelanomma holmii TaxID=210430 RepID=A0A9P4HCF6_9PLEO|nr:hypothetical protein EK21DRAFT_110592 [Setomelanomma holmii]